MLANQTVHEPKPFEEVGAPYKHSMEGAQAGQDSEQPLAYSWSPGWNSNQSNHKFRDEYRGDTLTAQGGVRCVIAVQKNQWFKWSPQWSKADKAKWQLLPLQKVFGSDNLSLHAFPVAQLKVQAQIVMRQAQAQKLNIAAGQLVYCDNNATLFHVVVDPQVPTNSLLIYVPADQYFSLRHCEQLTLATAKQSQEYTDKLQRALAHQTSQKQTQLQNMLAQDHTIPIHFIEGVV
jgi:NADH-quinone oxidoreductase subunit G